MNFNPATGEQLLNPFIIILLVVAVLVIAALLIVPVISKKLKKDSQPPSFVNDEDRFHVKDSDDE